MRFRRSRLDGIDGLFIRQFDNVARSIPWLFR